MSMDTYLRSLDPQQDLAAACGDALRLNGYTTLAELQAATFEDLLSMEIPRPKARLIADGPRGTAAAVVPGPAGSAPRPTPDITAFTARLKEPIFNQAQLSIDDKVLASVVKHFHAQAAFASSPETARAVYELAKKVPRTETRAQVQKNSNILINGLFHAHVTSKSTLLYAFDAVTCKVWLLKVPCDDAAADIELAAWNAIAPAEGTEAELHLAGPIKSISLKEPKGKGLLMPVYPATLEHVPQPLGVGAALQLLTDLLVALEHMHSREQCHNDLKPSNFFLMNDGHAVLGDFGSSRTVGAVTHERTWSHLPDLHTLPEHIVMDKSSKEGDRLQLAIALLGHMQKLHLPPDDQDPRVQYNSICDAVDVIDRIRSSESTQLAAKLRSCL